MSRTKTIHCVCASVPQNCIISEEDNKIKLIDLGAAADLRIGINYVPNEYLLDPRYMPTGVQSVTAALPSDGLW